jgi:hypothetical protein
VRSSRPWGWIDPRPRLRSAASVSAALLAFGVGAGLATSAQAATYTVGTLSDETGTCPEPASGKCSLRQLVEYENALPTPPSPSDVITLPSGRYNLTHGTLAITQSLVILGAGARTTDVDVPEGTLERVFDIRLPIGTSPVVPSVAILGLEISGGTANANNGGFGGNVRNQGAKVVLSEDWITGGSAFDGGGISNETGTLVVDHSLVSGNHANAGPGDSGGIQNYGSAVGCPTECRPGNKGILAVQDSTVAGNDARLGAGIYSWTEEGVADENGVSIVNSTIAYNKAQDEACGPECTARGPGAGLLVGEGVIDVTNSILAYNTETAAGVTTNTNCSHLGSGTIVSLLGYNLETEADCGFTSTGDLQKKNPLFSSGAPQNNGGNTDTLAPEPTSPAVDAIPANNQFCSGTDQRGVTRPQGAGCDIGAVEYASAAPPPSAPPVPPPPPAPPTLLATSPPTVLTTTSAAFTTTVNPHGLPTSVHFEYGPVLGGAKAAAITYGSVTPDQAVGADFANHTVTTTVTGLLPNVVYHVRAVATNSAGSALGSDQTLQTPADPPPPPPVLGKSVNVTPVSGIVYIKLPPVPPLASLSPFSLTLGTPAFAALTKGQAFVPLTEARQIPVGSILDTSAGVVGITTATTASKRGKLQSGDFEAGIFKLLQRRKQRGLTELDIIDNHSARLLCATRGKARSAARHPNSKVLGRLTANSHGHFTARGQYSAATVRGTSWGVLNRCDGTLTRVKRGVVTVRDFRRRKTITLFTGQTYLAKAPGY